MAVSSWEPLGRGELQRRAVRGALWTGIHTIVSLPVAFIVNILLARLLGVADYGRLTYLTTVIGIASVVAGLGVTTALIQFGAKAHASGDTDGVRRLLSGSQGFRLLVSGPLIAAAVFSLVRVEWWLLALALVFGVLAPAFFGNAHAALTIENRTDRAAQIAMVSNLISQVAVVGALVTLGTADAVWSARVIASGVLLALPMMVITARYRAAVLRPSFPWRLPRAFWAFALPTGLAGVIGVLVTDRTEIIFLDWFTDERAMGLFGLAFGLAGHVYAPAQAFIGPLVPAVSALAQVDEKSLRHAFHRTTRAGSAIGGLLIATALPALACLLPVIYGRDFAEASDLLIIVGIGSAVMLTGSPHQAFLMARLGGGRLLWVNTVSLVTNFILALALIPIFGALGAAIACAVTLIVRALQLTIGEALAIQASIRAVIANSSAMLLGLTISGGSWLVARQLELGELELAVILILSGLTLYVGSLKVCRSGLTREDVDAITRALPDRLKGVGGVVLWMVRGGQEA